MDEPLTESRTPSRWPYFKNPVVRGLIGFLILYFVIAYLVAPELWVHYARKHPSFDDNPRITKTHDGHPGDPLNVGIIGTEQQLKSILKAAEWFPADPLGLESDLRIGIDTVLEREYDKAPVSNLYLFGRKEDLAYEQPVGDNPRHRHHVRFWKTEDVSQHGRPLWIGSATYDERVGLSHTTGQITHHIAPDVDQERDHLIKSLQQTNDLREVYMEQAFHKVLEGKNGGGDPWHTDGDLGVGIIKNEE
ncbi:LssY C-terminal domain-containing protein [Rubinisphaera sp.]|uniref:LssY C-terminal domain-containing protein n=2 Tax=Rubinisphaera TaxID=1649490 RepID=UPI000C0C882E|nr:LssY C-terminal domain-containing protein [Rubinisphaera sp.]MBV08816.1 hypothetical protein [Rubinisphaera sp.]HCS53210.1 hypothetical protein [Planctomycetaceae bacterium]